MEVKVENRENIVFSAKLAEQAERYDEMVEAMKKIAQLDVELTVEERNLLSVAYKNVIGARRASWRILSSIEQKSNDTDNPTKLAEKSRKKVEDELTTICQDILNLIDKHLLQSSDKGESKVFYYKMKGDYHRYLAEFATGQARKEAAESSLVAYKQACTNAQNSLQSTHPIRLGLL